MGLLLALIGLGARASAAAVAGVHVTHHGARYLISMHLTIDAPPSAVFRALQDYTALAHHNPDVRSVRVEPTGQAGRVRLFTTIHACVLIFCKTLHQEQIMTATAAADGGVLLDQLVAHHGDFKQGQGRWTVSRCPAGGAPTCVSVRLELVPNFWVPPLIGPWLIRTKVRHEARLTSAGLAKTARRLASRSPHE